MSNPFLQSEGQNETDARTVQHHVREKESAKHSYLSKCEAHENYPPPPVVVLRDNRRENDGSHRHDSTYTSTPRLTRASTGRSKPRRDSTSTRDGPRDIYEKDERYPAVNSRSYDISSRYHYRGGYGAAPQTAHGSSENHDGFAGQKNYGSSGQHSVGHWGHGTSPQTTHNSAESRDGFPEQAGHGNPEQNLVGYLEYNTLEPRMESMSISEASEYGRGSGPPQLAPHTTYPTTYTDKDVFYEEGDEATALNTNREGSSKNPRSTAASPGRSLKLAQRYKERTNDYKKFFQRGRVFQTLWTTPYFETTNEKAERDNSSAVSTISYGDVVFTKPRRFVVVKYKGGLSCSCLAITSYDKRWHHKQGTRISEHGFIYSDTPPRKLSGIIKEPVRARLKHGEKLWEQSLINYGEIYTIQCNWKVKNIGELDEQSKKHLRNYFNQEMAAEMDNIGPNSVTERIAPLCQISGFEGVGSSLGNSRAQSSYYDPYPHQLDPDDSYGFARKKALAEAEENLAADGTMIGAYSDSSLDPPSTSITRVAEDRRVIVDSYMSGLPGSSDNSTNVNLGTSLYRGPEISPGSLDRDLLSSKPAAPAISRSSSKSSLSSVMSMTPSMSTVASSIASLINGGQRLFSLLSNDDELLLLYSDAVEKVSFQKFEDNLRRCLIQFAAHVKEEAISTESIAAAKIVQRYSRNVAHMIREELELRASRVPATTLLEDDDQGSNHELLEEDKRLQCQEQEDRDSDWDEKEESDQEDGLSHPVETEEIGGLLLASNAFQMLRDNLKLFVRPDPVHKALFLVWPVKEAKSSALEINYEVECEIVDFSQSYFPSGSPLGDLMTLTGASFDAQASTCRGYLATTWPDIGLLVLELFESLIVGNNNVQVENQYAKMSIQQDERQSDEIRTKLSVSVQADYNYHKEIMSAIAWLCSAVRYSATPHISLSSTSIEADKTPGHKNSIIIKLLDLDPIKSTNACWHALFPQAVIAKGFRIAPREEGKGLEISFADMLMMSRSLSFVTYEDGVIVEGLSTLLIPVAELSKDDALQWHFESKIKQGPRRNARVSKIMKNDNLLHWHKELNPETLADQRCFLGWVEKAHIVIGTEDFSRINVKYSDAKDVPNTRKAKTYSILLGVNFMSFGTLQGTFASKATARQSPLIFPMYKDILDSLADGCDDQALVFDTASKTGWYLPWSSIILYLAHKVIKRRGYQVYRGEEKCCLPFSSPGFDGGARALEILEQSLDLRIRSSESQQKNDEQPFSKMLTELWHKLDHTRNEIDSERSELKLAGEIAPKYIHGVELMDFVEMRESMKIKHAEVGQPWVHFTSLQPVVLFCKDFGQPIVPFRQRVICDLWSNVPPKLNYLVVTVAAVLYFLAIQEDEGCSRLGENIEWIIKSTLIQNHEHGKSDPIVHVQHLRSVKDATMDARVLEIRDYSQGWLVFTDHKPKARCYGLLKSTMIEPPVPFTETVQKPLPDLPDVSDSTSTSSADSHHDTNGGLSQSISVSSCESDVPNPIIQTKLIGSMVEQQTPDLAQMDDTRVEEGSMHISKNLASKGILNHHQRGLNLVHRQRNRKRQRVDSFGATNAGKAVLRRVDEAEAEAESSLISVRAKKKLGDRTESVDGKSSYCQQGNSLSSSMA